jgi:hypothetical protein
MLRNSDLRARFKSKSTVMVAKVTKNAGGKILTNEKKKKISF